MLQCDVLQNAGFVMAGMQPEAIDGIQSLEIIIMTNGKFS